MVRLVCALLLIAAAVSASPNRIVGGSDAAVEKYPSIVQVQSWAAGLWTQTCAGVILTSKYVLSSARCFDGPFSGPLFRRIIAGSSYRNSGGQVSSVVYAFNHPDYDDSIVGLSRAADITVVLLATPLQYSAVVQQAGIVGQGIAVPDNMPAVIAGWGVIAEGIGDVLTDVLQEASVFTVNNRLCADNYAAQAPVQLAVTEDMICSGRPEGGVGACVGDTGGPLYFGNVVVGVISWGLGCTNATFPNVHTAVASYSDWIIRTAV